MTSKAFQKRRTAILLRLDALRFRDDFKAIVESTARQLNLAEFHRPTDPKHTQLILKKLLRILKLIDPSGNPLPPTYHPPLLQNS